jgi:hypothetical protein
MGYISSVEEIIASVHHRRGDPVVVTKVGDISSYLEEGKVAFLAELLTFY